MKQSRPAWIPDSSVSACMQCKVTFSFDVRRHHCRCCGNIYCHYCSSKQRPLLSLAYLEPVRMCDKCHELCVTKDVFMEAVRSGDLRAVQQMLDNKIVQADDTTGTQTPLLVSSSRGHAEMLELLLDYGANVHAIQNPSAALNSRNVQNPPELPRGDSPLHYAAINGSVTSVQLLIKLNADLNRKSQRYGEAPLHKAVLFGHVDTVKVLLQSGASGTLKNDRGLSPCTLCAQCGDQDMISAFEAHGHPITPVCASNIRDDASINKDTMPNLLWEAVVSLYLYKRPKKARTHFAEAIVALHGKGYPVDSYIPQLCDLALHEPSGDHSLKHALLSISSASPTFAFSVWFFIRSVQDACPHTARTFLEVMEASVMGMGTPTGASTVPAGEVSPMRREASESPETPLSREASSVVTLGDSSASTRASTPLAAAKARNTSRDDTIESWDTSAAADMTSNSMLAQALETNSSDAGSQFVQSFSEQCSWSVAPTAKERRGMLLKSRKLVRVLTEIAAKLPFTGAAARRKELQVNLDRINDRLPPCLYLPIFQDQFHVFWVLSLPSEETTIFRTNKRAPYMCLAEINAVIPNESWQLRWRQTDTPQRSSRDRSRKGDARSRRGDSSGTRSGTAGGGGSERGSDEGIESERDSLVGGAGIDGGAEGPRYAGGPSEGGGVMGGSSRGDGRGDVQGKRVRRRGDGVGEGSVGRWLQDAKGLGTGRGEGGGPWQPEGPDACIYLEKGQMQSLYEVFGESWEEKKARIRMSSPHGHLQSWDLVGFIVKSGDDLRQEQFAMQLIEHFRDVFLNARLRLWLRPYRIVSTSADSGLIEYVPDTVSLHSLREKFADLKLPDQTLGAYFRRQYGPESSPAYKAAQRNFIESMAGYAVVCYLLQVKDRNDGNLLLTRNGHILHIDFGYMLTNTPGDMAFEQAPFKLTSEFVDVMGGKESASFAYFRELCVQGFLEARKRQNCEKIIMLVEMMSSGIGGEVGMPCVAGPTTGELVAQLRAMFMIGRSEDEVRAFVDGLIQQSLDNWYTRQYDNYQVLQKTLSSMFGGW